VVIGKLLFISFYFVCPVRKAENFDDLWQLSAFPAIGDHFNRRQQSAIKSMRLAASCPAPDIPGID
jgi:hypothetical protein